MAFTYQHSEQVKERIGQAPCITSGKIESYNFNNNVKELFQIVLNFHAVVFCVCFFLCMFCVCAFFFFLFFGSGLLFLFV